MQQCPQCKHDLREEYLVMYDAETITHVVRTHHAPMGDLQMDQIFGGGMHVLCGKPAKGRAVISPMLMPVTFVNCSNCNKALEAELKKETPVERSWPPKNIIDKTSDSRPRILGIPG